MASSGGECAGATEPTCNSKQGNISRRNQPRIDIPPSKVSPNVVTSSCSLATPGTPKDVERVSGLLKASSLQKLVSKRWNIRAAYLAQEWINFKADKSTSSRMSRIDYSPDAIAKIYGLANHGHCVNSFERNDVVMSWEKATWKKGGWVLSTRTSSVVFRSWVAVLKPILQPGRNGKVRKAVGNALAFEYYRHRLSGNACHRLSGNASHGEKNTDNFCINWAQYLSTKIHKMLLNANSNQRTFVSPYLYHIMQYQNLLEDEELLPEMTGGWTGRMLGGLGAPTEVEEEDNEEEDDEDTVSVDALTDEPMIENDEAHDEFIRVSKQLTAFSTIIANWKEQRQQQEARRKSLEGRNIALEAKLTRAGSEVRTLQIRLDAAESTAKELQDALDLQAHELALLRGEDRMKEQQNQRLEIENHNLFDDLDAALGEFDKDVADSGAKDVKIEQLGSQLRLQDEKLRNMQVQADDTARVSMPQRNDPIEMRLGKICRTCDLATACRGPKAILSLGRVTFARTFKCTVYSRIACGPYLRYASAPYTYPFGHLNVRHCVGDSTLNRGVFGRIPAVRPL